MIPGTLKAYIVVLSFEAPGPVVNVSTWTAPDAHTASALAMRQLMLGESATDANLVACVAPEMPAEMLRHYLRAAEGKLPDGGNAEVLHLVPPNGEESDFFNGVRGGQPLDAYHSGEALRQVPPGATPVAEMPWTKLPLCGEDEHEWEDGACKRCGSFTTKYQYAESKPLPGLQQSPPVYWGHRSHGAVWVYDEQFGPPNPGNEWMPPGSV